MANIERNEILANWAERERTQAADARTWVAAAVAEVFASDSGPYTVAEVMAKLDTRADAPAGYNRVCIPDAEAYVIRYTWVRNALNKLVKDAALTAQAGAATNSKGRPATTYSTIASASSQWAIDVSGGPRARRAAESLTAWLEANGDQLADLDGLLVTRLAEAAAASNPAPTGSGVRKLTSDQMNVLHSAPDAADTVPTMRRTRGTRSPRNRRNTE